MRLAAGLVIVAAATTAHAQASSSPSPSPSPAPLEVTVGGYLEAYYQLHLQAPANRLTNLRGFDSRSRTFTLSSLALSVTGARGPVTTRLVLQLGPTAAAYYLAEPESPGATGVAASSGALWRSVQTATAGIALAGDWAVEAGLFTSPIGPEVLAIKDDLTWSRSNLFFALPAYHTGVTLAHPLAAGWTGKAHLYNGWNSVVDADGAPSVALSASYAGARTSGQLLYFGGRERAPGAAEGAPWRHLVDAFVQTSADDLTVLAHLDAGVERGDVGTSWWAGGALYLALRLTPTIYAVARGDYLGEKRGGRAGATASPILLPVTWLASGTATVAYQPVGGVSIRLEARHDQADRDAFFAGAVAVDQRGDFVPDADRQDTVTLGLTTWF